MVKNIPGIILTFEIQIDFHLKTFYYVKLNPVTMKKSYLFFVLFLICGWQIQAQTTLYSSDFESYTVGLKIAQQAGAPWTTWTNAPGGTEDAVVSSTQSHSTSKSVYVTTNNDLVLNLFDKSAGRFKLSWWMYVESGKTGYFNVLSDFAAANSLWAFQTYMYNDSIYVDAGGTSAVKTTFAPNTWKHLVLIVDMDDDFATFYIDNVELVSYKWSKGAQGTGNSLKLDGIDFYGWDGASAPSPTTYTTSGYYIDDLSIDSVTAPAAPINLNAVLASPDINVSWNALSPTPDLYKLSRNGKIVAATNNINYTDVSPWANTYVYGVRAHYIGSGYSHSSNTDTVSVPGGVERNLVLMEGGTGTWCTYCPGAAKGLRDLIEVNNKNAVAVEYHSGDSYEIPAGVARINYYTITGFPTVIADGVIKAVGGNATTSMYPTYLPMYNERIANPAFHIITCNIVSTSFQNYQATITVEETFTAFAGGLKLLTALTESNIPEAWLGQTEVDFACRGMYPDENGTDLNFSVNPTQTVTLNFSTAGFVKNNCEFVMWVQHTSSMEVTQTMKVDLSTIVGMEELKGQRISVYPNPASNYVMVMTNGKGLIEIYDVTGKLQLSSRITDTNQYVDISGLSKGVYFLKTANSETNFTQKLVVQ